MISRLPVSMSSKRPSSSASMTGLSKNSSLAFNRQSHIPVTAKKANLFTPKDKKTTSFYAATTVSKQPFTTERKYQRPAKPAPDRDEQHRMFEKVVNFLKDNGYQYPLPEAKRFFLAVSSTEAARIFEFLLRFYFQDFKINQMEVDVPKALTLINYPYIKSVTKSALVSIATRQAACNLLVILHWLVDFPSMLVEESMDINNDKFELNGTTEGVANFEVVKLAMQHDPRENKQVFVNIAENIYGTEEEARVRMISHQQLTETRNKLFEESKRVHETRLEIETFIDDSNQCAEYKEKMKQYLEFRMTDKENKQAAYNEELSLTKKLAEEDAKAFKRELIVALEFYKNKKDQPESFVTGMRELRNFITKVNMTINDDDEESHSIKDSVNKLAELPPITEQELEEKDVMEEIKKLNQETMSIPPNMEEWEKSIQTIKAELQKQEDESEKCCAILDQEFENTSESVRNRNRDVAKDIALLKEENDRLYAEKENEENLFKVESDLKYKEVDIVLMKQNSILRDSLNQQEEQINDYRQSSIKFEQIIVDAKAAYRPLKKRLNPCKK